MLPHQQADCSSFDAVEIYPATCQWLIMFRIFLTRLRASL